MKKNLIALITMTAMLASSAAVFAANETPEPTEVPVATLTLEPAETASPEDVAIVPIADDVEMGENVNVVQSSYMVQEVTVTEAGEGTLATTINAEDAENPENTINYTITEDTIVLGYAKGDVKDVKDIKKDDKITVYSNAYAPAPLILPPQYQASVIFVYDNLEIDSLRMADVDTYVANEEGMLVNAANTLALNLDENTVITGLTGKMATQDELDKKDLAVVYSTSTRSIPAQTTPIAIYVIGENEMALAQLNAAEETPAPTEAPEATEAPAKEITLVEESYEKDGVKMVPLREVAESLGYTVEWDGELKMVTLNSGIYSLKIGENSYVKGRMVPVELKAAPEITNDLTYVPAEYFTELLEENVVFNN